MMRSFFLVLTFISLKTWAYPSFVSYGYKSCVTCHFNSQGNGPLTDYGRAVWSAEIASRAFYSDETSTDDIAESSGFLGKTPMPPWFRPGMKFRTLWFQTDPGSNNSTTRRIPMQADINSTFLFDEAQKLIAVFTFGYMPTPRALENSSGDIPKPSNAISREHYMRWNPNKNWFLYLGLMDKVYGIRTADHTAVNRQRTGLAMNDQSHGVMAQYNSEPWEITFNPFIGNLSQSEDLRQKGASAMIEKDFSEAHRIGGAVLSSENKYVRWNRVEAHSKLGLGHGNSLLTEVGAIENEPKGGDKDRGAYAFIEGQALLIQGYSFLSQLEYYNQTMSAKSPDQLRWTFGLLMFPAPRYEVRTNLVNSRTQSDSGVNPDQWQLQMQMHISL